MRQNLRAAAAAEDASALGVAGENCRLCGARIQTYLLEKDGSLRALFPSSLPTIDLSRCVSVTNKRGKGIITSSTRCIRHFGVTAYCVYWVVSLPPCSSKHTMQLLSIGFAENFFTRPCTPMLAFSES